MSVTQRRLIDHKKSCSARWTPSSSSPIKNHNRNVSARTRPRTICPRTMPTSAPPSASRDGPASEPRISPACASARASVIVETVNDRPSACTSLSRSNCEGLDVRSPGYDKNSGRHRDCAGRRPHDETEPGFRVPRHLEIYLDEAECCVERQSNSEPNGCAARVVMRQQHGTDESAHANSHEHRATGGVQAQQFHPQSKPARHSSQAMAPPKLPPPAPGTSAIRAGRWRPSASQVRWRL